MSKNRKLLYCSISDKAKVIKWAEEGAFAWENRSLKATELADPALGGLPQIYICDSRFVLVPW